MTLKNNIMYLNYEKSSFTLVGEKFSVIFLQCKIEITDENC